jgi:hypothetical protein
MKDRNIMALGLIVTSSELAHYPNWPLRDGFRVIIGCHLRGAFLLCERAMAKSILLAAFFLGQAAALLVAGAVTLWWSQDLMIFLIWLVGVERALGAQNVTRLENGSTLLTNPAAMFRWTLPIWFLGVAQITSALTLVWLWSRRLARRSSGPHSTRSVPDE